MVQTQNRQNRIFYLDWDSFVHSAIQLWEDFYLTWIKMGKQLLVIYYEDLKNIRRLKHTLKDVCKFLDFEFNEDRFSCILKHPYKKFKRKERCFENIEGEYLEGYNISNVFEEKHSVWINSAISRVYNALISRGMLSNTIQKYKNTVIKLNMC